MKGKIVLPLLLLLLNVAFYLYNKDSTQHVDTSSPKTIAISEHGFVPNELIFNKGDTISLVIRNMDRKTHNFVLPDFHIATRNLGAGDISTIQFKATKIGTFPFLSDTPGMPEPAYKGSLIIK